MNRSWIVAIATCCAAAAAFAEAQPRANLDDAETRLRHELELREKALGPNHLDVAASLHDLADLYAAQHLRGRAEPLYQRALSIRAAALGASHPDVATSLHALANVYAAQGMWGRAESLYKRALTIRRERLGDDHPHVATSLNDLAGLYQDQGRLERAEQLFERALAIREAALGGHHPDVASSLRNLARVYVAQEWYGQPEPLYKRALVILEATLGRNHAQVAQLLNDLASLYVDRGEYREAFPLLSRTLTMGRTTLGENHPEIGRALTLLGLIRQGESRLELALPLFTRAFAFTEGRLRREALDLSEARLVSFLQILRGAEERPYRFLRQHPDVIPLRHLALSTALLFKGRSIEETANISRTVYRSLGEEDRAAFDRLRELRTELATLSLLGPGSLSPSAHEQRLATLTAQGDALEAELARRSAPLRAVAALPSPGDVVERVAAALPRDAALVEFLAYTDLVPLPRPASGAQQDIFFATLSLGSNRVPVGEAQQYLHLAELAYTPTPVPAMPRLKRERRYLALILFPDASIRAVDLGPAEPIDRDASRLRDALASRDASFQSSSQTLYQRVFQPLVPLLGKRRRLFLSPDGQLNLVPFAALHDGRKFLLDSYDFTYLTSGRELLPRPQSAPPSSSVVVLADPDFRALPSSPPTPGTEPPVLATRSSSVDLFFSELRGDLAERPWTPLPGTRAEAQVIQQLLPQARLLLGAQATKQQLLQLPTPGVLHVATHGFFLEDAPVPESSRAVGHFGALGDEVRLPRTLDPLLRSGLVLAGAQAPEPGASPGARADASLVTALELGSLNLWGTQLVVLSACDTGRGEVEYGQGVYGLRRAFVVAGAETVVMSLWKVNDDTTRELMDRYYRNLLAGQGRGAALNEAMRSLSASRPHPYHWAPFIALGQDTPLRGLLPPPEASRK